MKITPGFNAVEASELLQICAQAEQFQNSLLPGEQSRLRIPAMLSEVPKPHNWELYYRQKATDTTNSGFEIWKKKANAEQFAVCFWARSHLQQLLKSSKYNRLVAAEINVKAVSEKKEKLADATHARVHFGLLSQLSRWLPDLIEQLIRISAKCRALFLYLTGHGIGAALANLFASWYGRQTLIPTKCYLPKVYAFGPPKCGNEAFATDFDQLFFNNRFVEAMAFRLVNDLDLVPKLPLSFPHAEDLKHKTRTRLADWRDYFLRWFMRPSANFQHCGVRVVLRGQSFEKLTENENNLLQHYLRHYYQLLIEQFPV